MPEFHENLRFDIHPSIVFQLGEGLVTDVIQAIVELVKNSWDADADYAKIIINTGINNYPESTYTGSKGYIVIEDNGFGMDYDTIKNGWLTISNSLKKGIKSTNKTTPRGRTPLGDKGVGRLGVQKLGNNVEILSRPKNGDIEYYTAFSWKDFYNVDKLGDVRVINNQISPPKRNIGTTIIVSDLNELETWTGNSIFKIQTELSKMFAPFEEIREFIVLLNIDGKQIDMVEINESLRNTAELSYKINFDETNYNIKGNVRLSFCEPEKQEDKSFFYELVEKDNGERFFEFLSSKNKANSFNLHKSTSDNWYLEIERNFNFSEIDKLKLIDGKIANPGPFFGIINSFDIDRSFKQQNTFDKTSEYRNLIKELAGIRVYRDGFAIRVDRDWLGLGQQQTTGTSFYGLRPGNTFGYIALTAKNNLKLEEKTDREGFKDTAYYYNFYSMLQRFVVFSSQAQEFIRRGWNDFKKENEIVKLNVKKEITPEEVLSKINKSLEKAKTYDNPLNKVKQNLENTISESEKILQKNPTEIQKTQIDGILLQLQKNIKDAQQIINQVEEYIKETAHIASFGELLQTQMEILRNQLEQFYEMISLGLTAEALSHEMFNIADNMANRTKNITQYLKTTNIKDSSLITYIEYVNSSIAALRKQISHFSPSLKYVREKKEIIELEIFFKEIKDYYEPRFHNNNIEIEIKQTKSNNFSLFIHK
jgi:hypothetical protein